jgi:hypothetical protein
MPSSRRLTPSDMRALARPPSPGECPKPRAQSERADSGEHPLCPRPRRRTLDERPLSRPTRNPSDELPLCPPSWHPNEFPALSAIIAPRQAPALSAVMIPSRRVPALSVNMAPRQAPALSADMAPTRQAPTRQASARSADMAPRRKSGAPYVGPRRRPDTLSISPSTPRDNNPKMPPQQPTRNQPRVKHPHIGQS